MPRQKINVEPRTIYPRYGRKRRVYDARGELDGIEYYVDAAPSAKAAREQVRAQVAYKRANPDIEHAGYKLKANDVGEWCFAFPYDGASLFSAADRAAAIEQVARDYADRPEIMAFVEHARRVAAGLPAAGTASKLLAPSARAATLHSHPTKDET